MNGVHDLGGMHSFGPIDTGADGQVAFHAAWEARVWAIMQATRDRYYTLDAFRWGIERMPPAHYLRAPYFERWLTSVITNLVEGGYLTDEELDARIAGTRLPDGALPAAADRSGSSPRPASALDSPAPIPRFAVGDQVVARNVHPAGHTRLPRYARGKPGVIVRAYGQQTFPDTNAHGLGEQPQPLYSVQFDGRDLWGESAEMGMLLTLDLWESYLESSRQGASD